jgi:predicted O-methyltransferase YrrM
MLNKIKRALKSTLPIYTYYQQLADEMKGWRKGLYPPGHYYSPVVDPQHVPAKLAIDYQQSIGEIDLNEQNQLALLESLVKYYSREMFPVNKTDKTRYYFDNEYFSFSDGIFLATLLQHQKPSRVIEIGSGYSSALMLDVNEQFLSNNMSLTFVEPYPEERLNRLMQGQDKATLIKDFVQNVSIDEFKKLKSGDILFVDSSHVSKFRSDFNYILFTVLPALAPGVIIHFHDVFFPFEYPVEWLKQGRSWNEAYLIRAFLQNNSNYEITLFTSFLEGKHRAWFEANMPLCLRKHEMIELSGQLQLMDTTGQSIYLRKK